MAGAADFANARMRHGAMTSASEGNWRRSRVKLVTRRLLWTRQGFWQRRTFGHTRFALRRAVAILDSMAWASLHRLCALVLALTLAVGLATHGVKAAQMSAQMAAAAMSAPMPDGCDGCDQGGDTMPACAALCAAMIAVLPLPPDLVSVAQAPAHPVLVLRATGLSGPPDPFPPKPSILS
ncbi:hypothetical protein [Microvirga arsenatis]|uniref:DUF2946 domain-containing protein n=2 Tax=Microvirga TaxID=186650 RepID=A0ABW9Z1S1_9HYPH|nr:hypothetical protein [Microvirga arsenatis]NBJ12750.1 hypothetical protein [Microvirga arsenatis]NBJ26609.1 hypothetical protein [Microvirga arsenatis]